MLKRCNSVPFQRNNKIHFDVEIFVLSLARFVATSKMMLALFPSQLSAFFNQPSDASTAHTYFPSLELLKTAGYAQSHKHNEIDCLFGESKNKNKANDLIAQQNQRKCSKFRLCSAHTNQKREPFDHNNNNKRACRCTKTITTRQNDKNCIFR